jgi:hypothetical protein
VGDNHDPAPALHSVPLLCGSQILQSMIIACMNDVISMGQFLTDFDEFYIRPPCSDAGHATAHQVGKAGKAFVCPTRGGERASCLKKANTVCKTVIRQVAG